MSTTPNIAGITICLPAAKAAADEESNRIWNAKISRSVIRDTLDDFLSEENPDYEDVVRETLTEKERAMALGKKMVNEQRASGKPLDRAFCAKVGRRLTSQGYGGDTIYSVIGMVMRQSEKEDRDERSI